MEQQPSDWEPEVGCLYECGECDLLFARPDAMVFNGRTFWQCPNCSGVQFYALGEPVVATFFYGIMGTTFDEAEMRLLRDIAYGAMGPVDPMTRWL